MGHSWWYEYGFHFALVPSRGFGHFATPRFGVRARIRGRVRLPLGGTNSSPIDSRMELYPKSDLGKPENLPQYTAPSDAPYTSSVRVSLISRSTLCRRPIPFPHSRILIQHRHYHNRLRQVLYPTSIHDQRPLRPRRSFPLLQHLSRKDIHMGLLTELHLQLQLLHQPLRPHLRPMSASCFDNRNNTSRRQ